MKPKLYLFLRFLGHAVFALLYRTRVTGSKHLPASGAVLICSNHVSLMDPLILGCMLRRPVHFMAKKELFQNKVLAAIIRSLGAISVDRGGSDIGAIRASLGVLKQNGVMGIFPQGTRDHDETRHKMENGAGLIALRSNAVVVPMRIFGPIRLFRRTRIALGAPVDLADLESKCDKASIELATQRIERAVWAIQS